MVLKPEGQSLYMESLRNMTHQRTSKYPALFLSVISFVLLSACSGQVLQEKEVDSVESNNSEQTILEGKVLKNDNAQKTYLINGQKYVASKGLLKAGTELKEITTHEKRLASMRFALVLKPEKKAEFEVFLADNAEILKHKALTENIHEVTYKDYQADLYELYQSLLVLPFIKQVEWQLPYPPAKPMDVM